MSKQFADGSTIKLIFELVKSELSKYLKIDKLTVSSTTGEETKVEKTVTSDGVALNFTLQPGPKGDAGHTPQKGVDYFTQEDIDSLNIPNINKSLLYYGDVSTIPSDPSLFTFTTDDETMTAIAGSIDNAYQIEDPLVVPYEYVSDGKVYKVVEANLVAYYTAESLTLPNTLKTIYFDDSTPYDEVIVIPEGVETIGSMNYMYPRSIVLPKSLKKIDNNCVFLRKFNAYYNGSELEWSRVTKTNTFTNYATMHYNWNVIAHRLSIEGRLSGVEQRLDNILSVKGVGF